MQRIVICFAIVFLVGLTVVAQQTAIVNSAKAPLMGKPDAKAKMIVLLKGNEKVEMFVDRDGWVLVQTSDYAGWIRSSFLSYDPSEAIKRPSGIGSAPPPGRGTGAGNGSGVGIGAGSGSDEDRTPVSIITKPLKILSKPRAAYTDAAKANAISGTVILRITFLSTGQIGGISPIKGLSYGLTEQAISAARQIKFEPAESNGIPVTVVKAVDFTFVQY